MQTVKQLFILIVLIGFALGNAPFAFAAPGDQKVYYYLHDHLGGIQAVTDEQGQVVEWRDYLPYGEDRLADDDPATDYGFTGKEQDPETELYYYGARYYDPMTGRFISPDPWEGDLADPQSLNKYSYARNNPVKYVDPTGESFIEVPLWYAAVQFLKSKNYNIAAHLLGYSINRNQFLPFGGKTEAKPLHFDTNSNNKMAQAIGQSIRSTKAYQEILNTVQSKINEGKLIGKGTGRFSNEDNKDLFYAINNFQYTFEAQKNDDGEYNINIQISDRYNFDLKEYDGAANTINNLGHFSQKTNSLLNYDITIDLQEDIKIEKEKAKKEKKEN